MNKPALALLSLVLGCFRFEVAGGVLSCVDDTCPNDLTCEDGLRSAEVDDGFCAVPEGEPCVANRGCSPTPECPIENGVEDCVSGVVCVDPATFGDLPSFQSGEGGVCARQADLEESDDCAPRNVLQRCPVGLGCSEDGLCGLRFGEPGDTCDNAIALDEPQALLLDLAGLSPDSVSDFNGNCGGTGIGPEIFLRYTVQGDLTDVTVSTDNNGTLSDTVLYIGTACDVVNTAIITGELNCNDDTPGDFSDFGSSLTLNNQTAGTELFIVVDSFQLGRDGLVEVTISEE
jgi:hypothetical protein